MTTLSLSVFVFFIYAIRIGEAVQYSSSQQNEFVTRHNLHRQNVHPRPNTPLTPMTWDADVASKAEAWANTCNFQHPTTESEKNTYMYANGVKLGQNIYYTSNKDPAATPPTKVTDAWHDEVYNWNFCERSCQSGKQCGHYTQIIWGGSVKVGCAYKECDFINGVGSSGLISVCNYSPAGNVNLYSQNAFPSNDCDKCSSVANKNCGEGYFNYASCQCQCRAEYKGTSCDQYNCEDHGTDDSSCSQYSPSTFAGGNCAPGGRFNIQCPVSCKLCAPPPPPTDTQGICDKGHPDDQSICTHASLQKSFFSMCSLIPVTLSGVTTRLSDLCPKRCKACASLP